MKLVFAFVSFFVITFCSFAQEVKKDNSLLLIDENVKIGKLENGLTYYIRKNSLPEKRVEMRLAINAGSLYETDEQQGLAHFTEHMCFNGTKNFPKAELVNFLEKMGIKFGGDLNAYTSFAETVYMLFLPTDNDELLSKGFQVLEDWAHNVSFEDKEIDKERGVIIEEWRLGLGADDRMRKRAFPIIFKDSKYADRIPIGKKEILETFKYETIRKSYKDWYRPNLMSVIVVGDIDIAKTEETIKNQFSKLTNPVNFSERTEYSLPDNNEPLISIETDKEATGNMLMYFIKHPHKIQATVEDFKDGLKAQIYGGILNNRLRELGQNPDCPYIMAYTYFSEFLARSNDAYMSYSMPKENKIAEAFELLLTESMRVKQFGFTQTEFERQKAEILMNYERAAKEVDKTESKVFTQQCLNNFLSKDPIMGAKNEFELTKKLLNEINLEEVNSLAKQWLIDKNQGIMVTAPEKEGSIVPTKAEILAILEKVKTLKLDAYVDNVSDSPLIENKPAEAKIISRTENTEFGYTEIKYENGVRVILKPTDFKNDEILLSAYSPGGSSQYPDADILSANYSTSIIASSGIGKFDNTELEKKLSAQKVDVNPTIDELSEGFEGNCSPNDFETMMQLVYLYFTQARKDSMAYGAFMSKMTNQFKFFRSSPQVAFSDTLVKIISSGNPRAIAIPTDSQLETVRLNKVYEIFTDRFSDADDFNFFIVGSFKIDSVLPFISSYLGALPTKHRKETWKDVSSKFPETTKEVTINKGLEPKSMVAVIMSGKFDWNYKEKLKLQIATDVLNIKLRESLREEQGGVYGVQIMNRTEKYPNPKYQVFVAFGCSPKNVKKLAKTVFNEVGKINKNGPTEEDLSKVKETMIRERETMLKKNKFWLSAIENSYYYNDDLKVINTYVEDINSITIDDVKAVANKYFTKEHYVKVVLMPEKK